MVLIIERYLHFGSKYRGNLLVDIWNTSINVISGKEKGHGGFGISHGSSGLDSSTTMVVQEIVLDGEMEERVRKLVRLYV
jgi:hypothetical protein